MPAIVVCYDFDGYRNFMHEDDMILATLGEEVAAERLTANQAQAILDGVLPEDTEPDDEDSYFPRVMGDWDYMPATHGFDAALDALDIDGAGIVREGLSPASGQFSRIDDAQTLEEVRTALRDDYRIVVLDGSEPADWAGSPESALEVINWARAREGLEPYQIDLSFLARRGEPADD